MLRYECGCDCCSENSRGDAVGRIWCQRWIRWPHRWPHLSIDTRRRGSLASRRRHRTTVRTIQQIHDPEGRATAAQTLKECDGLVVIGGTDLSPEPEPSPTSTIAVVGIPASIDNDLACTSYSIGVDTALNTITEACDRISDTARSHRRAFIVEVMGRHCGYLAMAAGISCMADAVLFREQGKNQEQLISELRQVIRRAYLSSRNKRRVLIIKAEGVAVPTATLAAKLEETLQEDSGGATLRFTVLGHVVRGGRPSFRDRMVASRLGYAAVNALAQGHSGVMVGWRPDEPNAIPFPDDPRIQMYTSMMF